jgi:tRNA modification GTPase
MYRADTIVACASPPGRGAVSVLRISGPEARSVLEAVFEAGRPGTLQPWRLRHGWIRDPEQDERLDEVLAAWMPGPSSYNGEDCAEIHCHGSPVVVEAILALLLRRGARSAEPGEFTRRAVLNGKLDLLQAEAIADLVEARVDAGARAAWAQLQGTLSERLASIRRGILGVLADVEANVDFSDEELPEENVPLRLEQLDRAAREIADLLAGFPAARRRREGWRVVFCGAPNAGKSSLVNALLGEGRMIVSDEPGTTRDLVEETVDLGGTAFVLTDSAGIRETESLAETAAIERARAAVKRADLVVHVVDASSTGRAVVLEGDPGRSIVVLNKADLPSRLAEAEKARLVAGARAVLSTSALLGEGVGELARVLQAIAGEENDHAPAASGRVRHRVALERAAQALAAARSAVARSDAAELAAADLRAALGELAEITEAVDNEEVLDVIFRDFCIGK